MTIDRPQMRHLPRLREIWKEGFGDSEDFLDLFFRWGFSPERCLCALVEDRPVSAIYWFDGTVRDARVAYLYALATDKVFQGRGIGRQLLRRVEETLRAQGYQAALLVPGSHSLGTWYQSQGYEYWGGVREFTLEEPGEPVFLELLTAAEYAAARKTLLPEGSVVQDLPALEFLAAQAGLYRGADFLAAALVDDRGELFVPELLGNAQAAPGILGALGCRKGTFRTPGGKQPAVMAKPLIQPGMERLSYFAFDFG